MAQRRRILQGGGHARPLVKDETRAHIYACSCTQCCVCDWKEERRSRFVPLRAGNGYRRASGHRRPSPVREFRLTPLRLIRRRDQHNPVIPLLVMMSCELRPEVGGQTCFYATEAALALGDDDVVARARRMRCVYEQGFGRVVVGEYPILSESWLVPTTQSPVAGDHGNDITRFHRSVTELQSEGEDAGQAPKEPFRHALIQRDDDGRDFVTVHAVRPLPSVRATDRAAATLSAGSDPIMRPFISALPTHTHTHTATARPRCASTTSRSSRTTARGSRCRGKRAKNSSRPCSCPRHSHRACSSSSGNGATLSYGTVEREGEEGRGQCRLGYPSPGECRLKLTFSCFH